MAEVLFQPRYALPPVRGPAVGWLRDVILDPFSPGREFGEALIEFREGERRLTMILLTDRELGYYLKYDPDGDTWLSLGDPHRLSEVVCPDDWQASAGLFIPPEEAWFAVSEFCRTGERSGAIRWARPSDIPPDGNW